MRFLLALCAAAAIAALGAPHTSEAEDPAILAGLSLDVIAVPVWDEAEQAWRDPASQKVWWLPDPGWVIADGLAHYWYNGAWHWRDGTPYAIPVAATAYDGSCWSHPDRYNWQKYAVQYDWPLDQLAYIIQHESGGDLCAVNPTSGAICWIQEISGLARFFDPATCMAQGYAKWLNGGRSFYAHWLRWW